jgi:hypothetical protein
LPAIFALLVGYILWQLRRERISLNYDVTESESFPRDAGVGKYFIIKLRNSGNKAIQDIAINIDFDSDVIETISFSDKQLVSDIEQTKSYLRSNLALLNPKEVLRITITALSKEYVGSPKVIARAIGATATVTEDAFNIQDSLLLFAASVALAMTAVAGYVTFDIFTKPSPSSAEAIVSMNTELERIRSVLSETVSSADALNELIRKREQGEPNAAQHIFSIFNRSGISHLFPDLIEKNGEMQYWKTGAYLMHRFLRDKENRERYITAMSKLIEVDRIAPSSLGFNLYLLAKMEHHRGNADRALKYLEECKKRAPLMYDYLMAQDPAYDTKAVEDYFAKGRTKSIN